ncbi:MAG: BMP family ABC transporter substrate-binding protein [Actinobacteria bacterium]|nr:BMP family ABC transporter substrate-binding protein [Actinomycetota bacterium]MBI3687446.1 BMP family ABC transporter substrate-binding protein [Actinomycetota bacterium]
MRRVRGLAVGGTALALASVLLAACGGNGTSTNAGSSTATSGAAAGPKVGMAYDVGGRGDQSFNDAAARGLDKAKSTYNASALEAEATQGETDAQKEDRLRQLADAGYNPIIAVGFAYAGPLGKVAKDYPKVKFAIIDDFTPGTDTGDNIANLTFAENEGSYLVGVAAALKSKTGKLGYIGGVNTPLLQKFQAGFDAGVKAAKPTATVDDKYLTQPPDFGGFNDPAKGQTAAQGMYDKGVDVIFAAAGGSGAGVFKAAKASGKLAIGVDSDQYNQPALLDVKSVIMTSMLKKVDVAVFDFVTAVKDGKFVAGNRVYDLKAGGVDYSTSGGMVDDIKATLDDYKQKIISGVIKVPATLS